MSKISLHVTPDTKRAVAYLKATGEPVATVVRREPHEARPEWTIYGPAGNELGKAASSFHLVGNITVCLAALLACQEAEPAKEQTNEQSTDSRS